MDDKEERLQIPQRSRQHLTLEMSTGRNTTLQYGSGWHKQASVFIF